MENFSLSPDFLYFHSQKESEGLSEKSIYLNNKEDRIDKISTPIDNLNALIDMDEQIYLKFRDDSSKLV